MQTNMKDNSPKTLLNNKKELHIKMVAIVWYVDLHLLFNECLSQPRICEFDFRW